MPSYSSSQGKNGDRIAQDAALLDVIDASSTMELHRSNLMRLQVQELLEECQLDLKERRWAAHAHEYLQTVTKLISQFNLTGNTNGNEKIHDRADKVGKVVFDSSTVLSVEPIGCTRSNLGWTKKSGNAQVLPTFSLMVTLPSKIFLPKDYLNYRYFDKRNHVMNMVAIHLAKHSKKVGSIEYKWFKGSNRSPYLQLIPKSSSSSKTKDPRFRVELHFGMQAIDWIPQLRLVPNRCNIKGQVVESSEVENDNGNVTISVESQLYNQSLLFDARHQFEDPYLTALGDFPNVEATLVLIQVWALQRGLWRNHDGWSKENAAIFLLYLLRTNRMNPRMTPIQQFTVVLNVWYNTNWLGLAKESASEGQQREPILRASQSQATQFMKNDVERRRRDVLVLPLEDSTEKETIRLSNLARLYEKQTKESPLSNDDPPSLIESYASIKHYTLGPVLLDPTLTYNYLGDVSPNYMRLLQFHAQKSLQGLKDSRSSFGYLFMKNARFWSQWDLYVRIPVKKSSKVGGKEWEPSVRSLISKLELALGNRIHGMRVLSTGNGDSSVEKDDLDQLHRHAIDKNSTYKRPLHLSPTGTSTIVIGFSVNPETSQRVVDRGPPSDQHKEVKKFVELWGNRAQLRRFKDGAIVQAVVWNEDADGEEHYSNEEKLQGGYVAKIARHIVRLHYTTENVECALPNLLSVVDGIATKEAAMVPLVDPLSAHQNIMKAFDSLATFLRSHSQPGQSTGKGEASLGLPLAIDAVEPLSPCLRYSELFPPLPHPFLGGKSLSRKKVAGAMVSDPVIIQIRFGASSKWPSDLKAIGAAKTAMLIQLANGIDSLKNRDFYGPVLVTPTYLDLGFRGYCFRILVRADPEIKMLQGLVRPSATASALLQDLMRAHVVAAKHHSMIHAVHTLHPSSAAVVRMAKRWVANHLLSGLISIETIELVVAKVYSNGETPLETPSTVMSGFLRFLHLLSHHDWVGEPLIVNPRGHIEDEDYDEILRQFERSRGENRESGPPMYIIAPYDKRVVEDEDDMNRNAVSASKETTWTPSNTSPEWVVVHRATALAKRSYEFMMKRLCSFDGSSDWSAIFHESASSFQSYSVLLRVGMEFVIDPEASSTGNDLGPTPIKEGNGNGTGQLETSYTRSMRFRLDGPKGLRRTVYRNLQIASGRGGSDNSNTLLLTFQPVQSVVATLRSKFGKYALFFYNDLAPEVIGIVWRPQTYASMPFSAMTAEYARPKDDCCSDWKNDSLVVRNATDLLRHMSEYYQDVVTHVKVVDESCLAPSSKRRKVSDLDTLKQNKGRKGLKDDSDGESGSEVDDTKGKH